MTRSTTNTPDEDDAAPTLTRGARARRALLLRRAANRTSRRILRSLGTDVRSSAEPSTTTFERRPAGPLGSPVQPDEALDADRNRWGGRL